MTLFEEDVKQQNRNVRCIYNNYHFPDMDRMARMRKIAPDAPELFHQITEKYYAEMVAMRTEILRLERVICAWERSIDDAENEAEEPQHQFDF